MKIIFTFISLIFCFQFLPAQFTIEYASNVPRHGDVLDRVRVDYIEPGNRGFDQVWKLGRVGDHCEYASQRVVSSGDTIALFDVGQVCHFFVQENTLSFKGFQSSRAYMLCDTLRPLLVYPFHFGDSISTQFTGSGRDENAIVHRSGRCYSFADGTGILTDGIDTLCNALRVHFHEDFTDTYFSADTVSIHMVGDRYSWFVSGCRYPVQESLCRFLIDGDSVFQTECQTLLFLPDSQAELADDPANDSIRSSWTASSYLYQQPLPLTNFQAGVSADGNRLNMCFSLTEICDFSIVACDVTGNVLCSLHRSGCSPGDCQESLLLSRHPVGNILMISVQCNEQAMSYKVNT